MPGSVTEILIEDFVKIRADFRKICGDLDIIRAEVYQIELRLSEPRDELFKPIKGDFHTIRRDLAATETYSRSILANLTELRDEIRGFAKWMIVCSLLISMMNIFATICFLTDFRFFAPAG